MKHTSIQKPEINPKLTYGAITSFRCQQGVTPEHGKYRFCLYLTFENHPTSITIQRGGFAKKSEALKAKELALSQLHDNIFIPWDFKVKEVYDYWLYYVRLEEISYNTFSSYKNIIYNYIIPALGEKKLSQINHTCLADIAEKLLPQKASFQLLKGVLHASFKYMKNANLIRYNPISTVFRMVEGEEKKEILETQNPALPKKTKKKFKVMSAEQASYLLYSCKTYAFANFLYMPLLFTICTGVRISEAFAIKFSDVNFREKTISIKRQLGKRPDGQRINASSVLAQEITPKTRNGIRTIPVSDFVLDEIILAKNRYNQMKQECSDFYDYDYITCNPNGTAIIVQYAYEPYALLYRECKMEPLRWHDLRHTYSTLLHKQGLINLKAISTFMGHKSEDFTLEYYIAEEDEFVYDTSEIIQEFVQELDPTLVDTKPSFSDDNRDCLFSDDYLLEILP